MEGLHPATYAKELVMEQARIFRDTGDICGLTRIPDRGASV